MFSIVSVDHTKCHDMRQFTLEPTPTPESYVQIPNKILLELSLG